MLDTRKHEFKTFHFNEIQEDLVELVKQSIIGINRTEWVSREEFHEKKAIDAFIRIVWSFANGAKTYLFGEQIEPYRRSLHMAVVYGEFDEISSITLGFSEWPEYLKTIKDRRIFLRHKIEEYRKTNTLPKELWCFLGENQRKQLEKNERLQQLQQLLRLQQLERLQQLQQLEQLEQLEQLQQLERISFSSLDYRDVEILPNSVVYCDIPYKGTKGYANEFNHNEFFEWAATRDFPVYISEYNVEDHRFDCIFETEKMVKACNPNNRKKSSVIEKVYWNRVSLDDDSLNF